MSIKVKEAAVAYISNPLKKVNTDKPKAMVVPVYKWSNFDKINAIRDGISKEDLENLKEQAGLDYETLATLLNVAKATLHNKKGKSRFDTTISEKIFFLADVYSYGYEVFGNKTNFNEWMKKPNQALGGASPLSYLDTLYGIEEIKHLIGRIEYGVYS
jgi:putative toxin-antitoxin system antitoxin component (TIGR02293 family)